MEEFIKWLNEQKNSVAWSLLGEESRLYQAWVRGAINQARLTKRAWAICAPEYHASLDEAGDRFCKACGQPLSQYASR
jgi:hypothetical protein